MSLDALRRLRGDFPLYASKALEIRGKSGKGPLVLNSAQEYLHKRLEEQIEDVGRVRALVLKGRQQGISTYTQGRYYWRVTGGWGRQAFILTHEEAATKNLFAMARRYHDSCPAPLRPRAQRASTTELYFDRLDSGYAVGTARTKGTGRSGTIQYFHGCLAAGSLVQNGDQQAVPIETLKPGADVITHTGDRAQVSFVSQQRKQCYTMRVWGSGISVTGSAEHRYLTPDGWFELSDLSPGDVIGYPVRAISKEKTGFDLKLPDVARPQGGGTVERVPERTPATYGMGRVLGLYLAEGVVACQHKTGVPASVTFAVHDREVPRTIEWLHAVRECFVSLKVVDRPGCQTSTVTVYGKSFASLVDRLCGRTDGKRMPPGWWQYGGDFVRGLIHGYLAGDGHSSTREYDRRISAPSIREAITLGMRDALASMGYGWAVVSYRACGLRNGRNERAQWTLRLSGPGVDQIAKDLGWGMPPRRRKGRQKVEIKNGYAWLPIQSIEDAGEREVYDLEVDHPDHSYCLPQCATHNSEVAFWPNQAEHAAGVMQAIPSGDEGEGTEAILESTANGVGDLFHRYWQAAERGVGEYQPIFIPWFWQEEYRSPVPPGFELTDEEGEYMEAHGLDLQQMAWRRIKIEQDFEGEVWLFRQEYPAFPAEAFQVPARHPLLDPERVMAARKASVVPKGPKILGVDVARQGKDRSAVALRQGRKVHFAVAKRDPDLMSVAGWVARLYGLHQPDAVFIDATGGYGAAVVDRLRELNIPCTEVQYGGRAREHDKYRDKRSEIWGEMAAWMRRGVVALPDQDDLHTDLVGPQHGHESSGRMWLERKEDMAKRGISSPDVGDALANTFAEPVQTRETVNRITQSPRQPATSAGY